MICDSCKDQHPQVTKTYINYVCGLLESTAKEMVALGHVVPPEHGMLIETNDAGMPCKISFWSRSGAKILHCEGVPVHSRH